MANVKSCVAMMTVENIANLIEGRIVTGHTIFNGIIERAIASDLMSDVLTLRTNNLVLITGLVNLQTIRTAEFSDVHCIILARNKRATQEMIDLANENEIVVIECGFSVFKTCGILYQAGVLPVY